MKLKSLNTKWQRKFWLGNSEREYDNAERGFDLVYSNSATKTVIGPEDDRSFKKFLIG